MNLLDRLIETIAPRWAFKRQQYRDALRLLEEPPERRRPRDNEGWVRLEDPANPLCPTRVTELRDSSRRRSWTW
jgi:hypothetical protein